jgi:cob(I)alamin adenosyltransferase
MARRVMGKGDDGFTDILGPGRVPKYHPRPEAYGAIDEASAALGLARALTASPQRSSMAERAQTDLSRIMTELATTAENRERFECIGAEDVAWLEQACEAVGQQTEMPTHFIACGESLPGAAFNLARTAVRRAERQVSRLLHAGEIKNADMLPYLNRLSSLCFALVVAEDEEVKVNPSKSELRPAE